jgi:hypothetical protein
MAGTDSPLMSILVFSGFMSVFFIQIIKCWWAKGWVYIDPSSNAGVRGIIHGMVGKTSLCKNSYKKRLTPTWTLIYTPRSSLLKISSFFDINSLHSACVADSASLCCASVSNNQRLSACIQYFQKIIFPYT